MNPSFNLIDQPWIPCLMLDGTYQELNWFELLTQAHYIKALACETALMNTALLAPTLAILHRVFGPAEDKDWERLWRGGHFPAEPIRAYFEQWYERFDLFHPERPFYQASDSRVKPKSVLHLIHSVGNTGTLFIHDTEETPIQLSPSQAAIHLITAQSFRTAGLSGLEEKFTDSTYTRGVLFWGHGETLFTTLMLNLMPYPSEFAMPYTNEDKPSWEMANPFEPSRNVPHGYLDYLTWQSNFIYLMPEQISGNVIVKEMTIAPASSPEQAVFSPQKLYEKRVKKAKDKPDEVSYGFLYFNSNKDLWRSYNTLFALDTDNITPPKVVEWYAYLANYGILSSNEPLRLTASGMLADQAKPLFYRQEILPIPIEVLRQPQLMSYINLAIQNAEEVSGRLNKSLKVLASHVLMRGGERQPDGGDVSKLVQQWDALAYYWSALEEQFWVYLEQVVASPDEADDAWRATLEKQAHASLQYAISLCGHDASTLKGRAEASKTLRNLLNKFFKDSTVEK